MIYFKSLRRSLNNLFLSLVIVTSGACTGHVAHLTLVSTRNVNIEGRALNLRDGVRITGEDCGYALLGLIPLEVPSLEDAVDDALENANGNILTDTQVSASVFHAILFSQTCMKVVGAAVKIPEKS